MAHRTGGAPIGGRVGSLREGVTPVSAPRDRPDRGFASGARTSRPPLARPARIFLAKAPRFWWENPHARASSRRRLLASSVRVRGISARAVTVGSPRSDPPEGRFAILVAARARPRRPRRVSRFPSPFPRFSFSSPPERRPRASPATPMAPPTPSDSAGGSNAATAEEALPPQPRARRAPRRARAQPPRATPHRQRPPPDAAASWIPGPGPRAPRAQPRRRRRWRASARALHAELRLHRAPMGPRHGLHQHRRRRPGRARFRQRQRRRLVRRGVHRRRPRRQHPGATPSRRARRAAAGRTSPRTRMAKRLKGRSRARTARRAWRARRIRSAPVPPTRAGARRRWIPRPSR